MVGGVPCGPCLTPGSRFPGALQVLAQESRCGAAPLRGLEPHGCWGPPRHQCLLWPGTGVSRSPTLLPRRTKLGALRAQHLHMCLGPSCVPLHSLLLPRASLLTQPWPRPQAVADAAGGCRTVWICVYF